MAVSGLILAYPHNCVCIYIYIHNVYVYVCVHIHIYMLQYVYTQCIILHIHVRMCINIYIPQHIYIYIRYTTIYIYIWRETYRPLNTLKHMCTYNLYTTWKHFTKPLPTENSIKHFNCGGCKSFFHPCCTCRTLLLWLRMCADELHQQQMAMALVKHFVHVQHAGISKFMVVP